MSSVVGYAPALLARRGPAAARSRAARLATRVVVLLIAAMGLLGLAAPAASAHVVPSSSLRLDVAADEISAQLAIPLDDLEAATGLDLGDQTQAEVDAEASAIRAYLLAHVAPTGDDGSAWTVSVGALSVVTTGDPATTGRYQQLTTTLEMTPPAGGDVRSFDLGYDAVVERVATHVVIVSVGSDWSGGTVEAADTDPYEIGVIRRDTVTNAVVPLHVDLGPGSDLRGFWSMVSLGIHHIEEGTDHQLFLLTLLLPAPLLARSGRWTDAVAGRRALRRIAAITASFTLGHSVTLALGVLGLPVAQGWVEALIAVSILVAALHAVRPIFPGREALVAGTFGLIHGLAFSETLRAMDLTGSRLVLSLLGFNLGIEAMQLIVVALVLPPLVLLARADRYRRLRVVAAAATAVAALGWLAARLGLANPIADVADRLGAVSVPVVAALWIAAVLVTRAGRRRTRPGLRPVASPEQSTAVAVRAGR